MIASAVDSGKGQHDIAGTSSGNKIMAAAGYLPNRIKDPCQTCTSSALSVTSANTMTITIGPAEGGRSSGPLILSGHTVLSRDRVLVRHGVTVAGGALSSSYNGIYTAAYAGNDTATVACVLTRADDMDTSADAVCATTLVTSGDEVGALYMVNTPVRSYRFALGSNALIWTQVNLASGGGFTAAGAGLSSSSSTVRLNLSTIADGDAITDCTGVEVFGVHNGSAQKKITYANLRNAVFSDVSGGAVVSSGGILTLQSGTVTSAMLAGSIANAKLASSTISGVALGQTLAALIIGTGLGSGGAGTYTGASAVTVGLDIPGLAALSGILAAGDRFVVYDLDTTTHVRCNTSDVDAYVSASATVMTNKVITAPTINSGTINTATLTTPTVTGLLTTSGNIMMASGGRIGAGGDADLVTLAPDLVQIAGGITIATNGYIGCTSDTDLLQLKNGELVVLGSVMASSDADLKKDIAQCGGIGLVRKMRGTQWRWKSTGVPSLGVIAQEIEGVVPELVSRGPHGRTVNYNGLIGVSINALNDLDSMVGSLTELVSALTSRVSMLTTQLSILTTQVGARSARENRATMAGS